MATDHRIIRNEGDFRGLDKRSSDIDVPIQYATDIENAQYRTSGAINKRKGFHYCSKSTDNSYGMFTYKKVNSSNGSSDEELLMVNRYLNKLVDKPLIVNRDDTSLIGNLFDLDSTDYSNERSILFMEKDQSHPDFANEAEWIASFGTKQNTYILSIPAADADLLENTTIFIGAEETLLRVTEGTTIEQIPDPSNPLYKIRVRRYKLIGESDILKNSILGTGSHTGHSVSVKQGTVQVKLVARHLDDEGKLQDDFNFVITDLNTDADLLNVSLGTGENSGDLTIKELQVLIDNIFGMSSSTQYPVDSPAAATLDITYTSIGPGGTLSLQSLNWERVPNGMGITEDDEFNPVVIFDAYNRENNSAKITDKTYLENASIVELNNVVYISNGFDHLMKYDGEQVYRAGLPEPDMYANPLSQVGGGSGAKSYFYGVMYTFEDAKGNIISSRLAYKEIKIASEFSEDGTGVKVDFKVPRLTDEDFCLKDTDGSPNPRLKIRFFRTTEGAGLAGPFYELATLENGLTTANTLYTSGDPIANTIDSAEVTNDDYYTFRDNYPDSAIQNLQTAYILPGSKTHDLPPKGKYLSTFKNCLVVAGQPSNVNNISYSVGGSEILGEIGSEYFPAADNQVIVESPVDTAITAIAPLRDLLYIFHANSIHVLAGDISDPNGIPYTIDLLSREASIGCVSNSSIVEFRNKLMFMSDEGLYTIDSSSAINELSLKVRPLFKLQPYSFKRTVSTVWGDSQLIIVNIPKEVEGGANTYVDQGNSLTLVYDYFRDAWLKWSNIDMSGGTQEYKEAVFFSTREAIQSRLATFNTSNTRYDFADHVGHVVFKYDTNWESLGEPSVPKKFLRIKLYAFDNEEEFESPKFSLITTFQKDYFDSDLGGIDFTFGENVLGYGNAAWDTFNWGDTTESKRKSKLPTGKAYSFKVKLSNNNINENVLLTKYELEVATPYKMEVKE